MAKSSITIRTEPENLKKLDWLATATDRSRNYLVNAAIERYLKEEEEFVAAVRRGQADVKAGRTTPHDQVFEELDAYIEGRVKELEQ